MNEMKPINVGLLGIGTVGGGTWAVLARNQEEITRRAGRGIVITAVADKDQARARQVRPMPVRPVPHWLRCWAVMRNKFCRFLQA